MQNDYSLERTGGEELMEQQTLHKARSININKYVGSKGIRYNNANIKNRIKATSKIL